MLSLLFFLYSYAFAKLRPIQLQSACFSVGLVYLSVRLCVSVCLSSEPGFVTRRHLASKKHSAAKILYLALLLVLTTYYLPPAVCVGMAVGIWCDTCCIYCIALIDIIIAIIARRAGADCFYCCIHNASEYWLLNHAQQYQYCTSYFWRGYFTVRQFRTCS